MAAAPRRPPGCGASAQGDEGVDQEQDQVAIQKAGVTRPVQGEVGLGLEEGVPRLVLAPAERHRRRGQIRQLGSGLDFDPGPGQGAGGEVELGQETALATGDRWSLPSGLTCRR